ncbi:putative fructosyl amine:oxygen oxidoreductase [Phaeomoniella chlamydospora]|uniref:Putative fructosyl amine:oxygen oxidoreductase n=1 Tax=Phaeomoniella chlamydospora TaxID=158046 RepID=A0A0G2E7S8_PHACM|nr:putative fructosyl amine:oxygen oxidoreductase [Phaeomoniella chlamydospora]
MTDPVFKQYYHPHGYVVAASSPDALNRLEHEELPEDKSEYIPLETAEDFRKTMPKGVLTGEFPGWKGWWKKTGAGWVHARKALVSASKEAERLGVKFITGSPQGNVTSLIYSEGHQNGEVLGATTEDGKEHLATRTILCAGATAPRLLDVKNQLRPTAWTLAHIKMTAEEVKLYKDLPVLFNIEKGFFMEPDEDKHELKMCDEHPGYCNWLPDPDSPSGKTSVPFAKHQIPIEAEERARGFLRDIMPHLADRPFTFARICWCADTPDRNFLIGPHPDHKGLVLGIGDSGHGYKHITSIGGFIVDSMEGILDERMAEGMRWRPETATDPDWVTGTLGRFGGPNKVMDFQVDVKGWTNIPRHS